MTTPEFALPEALVEAAMKAIHDFDCDEGPLCEELMALDSRYGRHARAALTGALAGCEVREEWGVRSQWLEEPDDYWRGPRDKARRSLDLRRASSTVETVLVRRLIVTTPGEEVPS